ncbi:hypothetical protein DVH24_001945 [Malus domestica]|uniref:Uncharacterized protein n=1 Tax=Malus domestica TaxID=3750 RepID=A0A498I8W5_MALDO|nr:hypothetical protein DVH24_001945 [Malus domestica]
MRLFHRSTITTTLSPPMLRKPGPKPDSAQHQQPFTVEDSRDPQAGLQSETIPVCRVCSTKDLDLQTINSMHSNRVQVVQHLQYGGYNRLSESSPL